jgi:hypothetical protein
MRLVVEGWFYLLVWLGVAVVLVPTGVGGVLLAAAAGGCGVYRARADGVHLRR